MGRSTGANACSIHDQTKLLEKREVVIVFAGLAFAMFIAYADMSGIGVILPTIGRDLHAESTISWAGTSGLIANTVSQVMYGRLSDIYGRKWIFLSAIALLSISDILCGVSVNATMLYVFRGLAGVANAGITSLAMMVVSDEVSLEERGIYMGLLSACVGGGNMIAPFLAATFAQRSTWRGFYYVLGPLGALCGCVCLATLPSYCPLRTMTFREKLRLVDVMGLLTGAVAIIMLLIPISGGGVHMAWNSPTAIAMLTVGIAFAISFFFVEFKYAALPMMPLHIFMNRPACTLLIQNIFFGFVYFSQIYHLPLFFQNALQHPPTTSALLLLPLFAMHSITSVLSGQYIARKKRYAEIIYFGFFLWTFGAALICTFSRTTPIPTIVLVLALQGSGIGMVFQPTITALHAHGRNEDRAVLISNRNFLRSVGGAVGLAVTAAVLQTRLRTRLPAGFTDLAKKTYAPPSFEGLEAGVRKLVLEAFADASRWVFVLCVPMLALCLASCMLVPDVGLTQKGPQEKQLTAGGEAGSDGGRQARGREEGGDWAGELAENDVPMVAKTPSSSKRKWSGSTEARSPSEEQVGVTLSDSTEPPPSNTDTAGLGNARSSLEVEV